LPRAKLKNVEYVCILPRMCDPRGDCDVRDKKHDRYGRRKLDDVCLGRKRPDPRKPGRKRREPPCPHICHYTSEEGKSRFISSKLVRLNPPVIVSFECELHKPSFDQLKALHYCTQIKCCHCHLVRNEIKL
jgi:hypothetical protein